eukprot:9481111-Pyramimonas_sp.AAC.1
MNIKDSGLLLGRPLGGLFGLLRGLSGQVDWEGLTAGAADPGDDGVDLGDEDDGEGTSGGGGRHR